MNQQEKLYHEAEMQRGKESFARHKTLDAWEADVKQWKERAEKAEAEVTELKAYQEKLLCENEIHEQCIANIIDTKPGGSIEGQMIAATQACVRAEQRNEELENELAALKKDVGFLCSRICYSSDFRTPQDVYEAAQRILDATSEDAAFARGDMLQAPCFKCGYNGEGYFQPDMHACAEKHHTLWKEKQ